MLEAGRYVELIGPEGHFVMIKSYSFLCRPGGEFPGLKRRRQCRRSYTGSNLRMVTNPTVDEWAKILQKEENRAIKNSLLDSVGRNSIWFFGPKLGVLLTALNSIPN